MENIPSPGIIGRYLLGHYKNMKTGKRKRREFFSENVQDKGRKRKDKRKLESKIVKYMHKVGGGGDTGIKGVNNYYIHI